MNILFLIDPNSIHDQKWVSKFTSDNTYNCFFICRKVHFNKSNIESFESASNISFEGVVDYFSYKKIFNSLAQVRLIKKIISTQNIQIFHIQYAEPNALWALFRRYFKIPVIITCRGTDVLKTIPEHFSKKDLFNRLISISYKFSFQQADWVTFTSTSQLNSVLHFSQKVKNKTIIRTGVDLKKLFSDTSSLLPKNLNKPYFLFPRYLKPIYNHEFTIQALKQLPITIKDKYLMVFIGKDSGVIEYQNFLINQLEEDSQIKYEFLPKLNQASIYELYKNATIIVMTPKSDGSPVSGMEAIALNKKLILGPIEYDQEIFNVPNVYKLKSWSPDELSSLIKFVIKKGNTTRKTDEYLNKIDSDYNMQIMNTIYKNLVIGN